MIPYGRQSVDQADIDAVIEVLRGDWLTQGPFVTKFEDDLCRITGAVHAVAFSSGTAALHGAAFAAGLGPGKLVATPALTFAASANCARYVGAEVTFIDIDAATLNLDVTAVPPGVDALVAVHYAGLPVDLSQLSERPPVVIEDAAHALGATTANGPVGNCALSDMCAFSFHPVKHVTTGEGGAVTTNDPDLAERLRTFRHHGIRRRPEKGAWYYEIETVGYNYRLTDIQAALGSSQLRKLERFVTRRNQLAARYDDLLSELPIRPAPRARVGARHAYHLYPVRVAERRRVFDGLRSAGIGAQVHYVPVHHHPAYESVPAQLPCTDAAYEGLISLPMYPDLTDEQQDGVVAVLQGLV